MDNFPLVQRQAHEAFLQCATSVDDWNTRATFLELLHIPTPEDIHIFCQGKFVERWKQRQPNDGFYWHCTDTNCTDYSTVYSRSEVRNAYFKQVERLTKRVVTFLQEGSARLTALARAPGLEDEQKVILMLNYRSTERIPTKEPVGLDQDGRVVCQYRRQSLFQEERALLEAAGLA